jgi:hypothetical protein
MSTPLSITKVPAGTKTVPPAGKMVIAPFPETDDVVCCRGMVPENGRMGFPVG